MRIESVLNDNINNNPLRVRISKCANFNYKNLLRKYLALSFEINIVDRMTTSFCTK